VKTKSKNSSNATMALVSFSLNHSLILFSFYLANANSFHYEE
jgi:hypothetical protein